ncbi:MAG: cytochrome c oxidase subunit II [Spirochaetes bacterium]|nr:MAG: cytochrome c oxidase subunit II [Spirochaetota bacterium]
MVYNVVQHIDEALIYIIGISLALLLLITAVMIFFLFRYRASRNPRAADIRNNWKVEVVWTLLPSLIALSMFYVGWESYIGLRSVPPGALTIDVTAMKYAWVFTYPNKKQSEGVLVVPQGQAVKLNLTSLDVIHSFYLPAFRIKMDALRGMTTYTWFHADKPGTYTILCAEYCGTGHADMSGLLRIIPESEYQVWLNGK